MYRKILVPLDGSKMAECVIPHVKTIAKGSEGIEIVLFRVCEPPVILADYPPSLKADWAAHVQEETAHAQEQCSLYLGNAEKSLREAGFKTTTQSGLGKPAEEIVNYSVANGVDLIVMATHGRSAVTRWAFGSIADKVLRSSPVPVMVVRPEECKEGM
jgi:nucleotide-binding universal stress UspA family protein